MDLVISSDPEDTLEVEFKDLLDYETVFVTSKNASAGSNAYITADDVRDQTLITYPIELTRLDIFSQLLTPN